MVVHVGTNNVRLRQSEITEGSLARTFEVARKMCRLRLIVSSGPLPVQGNDEMYSRLTSMSRCLAHHGREQRLGFVDNLSSLSNNIDGCLKQV